MSDKIYYTAGELQTRWEISGATFATMKKNGNTPAETQFGKAVKYHIEAILKWEDAKSGPVEEQSNVETG